MKKADGKSQASKVQQLSRRLVLLGLLAMPTIAAAQEKDQIVLGGLIDETTLGDNGWGQLIEEYNAANPDVEVIAVTGLEWEQMATMILAGDSPDLLLVSSYIVSLAPNLPGSIDVSPWITEADRADYGTMLTQLEHPFIPGHIIGFPIEMRAEPEMCANLDVFSDEGIDVGKIRQEGWTWDEFIQVAQQLTVDANGHHPNEPEFDANNVTRWAYGGIRDSLIWYFYLSVQNNGVPPIAAFGGTFEYNRMKPQVAETAQWIQDWLYEYRIVNPAILGMGDPQLLLSFQELINGKTAIQANGGPVCEGMVEEYNLSVERGEIAGEALEANLGSLPLPYNPDNAEHETYIVRPIYLQMMSQQPYKGAAHAQNVGDFAAWLTSAETQLRLCTEIAEVSCPTPARQSVREVVVTDPQVRTDLERMVERSVYSPLTSGPATGPLRLQVRNPLMDQLFARQITGEQLAEEYGTRGQAIVDDWVRNATERDEVLVELQCTYPEGYVRFLPEDFPAYEPVVSAACQNKLSELGIETRLGLE